MRVFLHRSCYSHPKACVLRSACLPADRLDILYEITISTALITRSAAGLSPVVHVLRFGCSGRHFNLQVFH